MSEKEKKNRVSQKFSNIWERASLQLVHYVTEAVQAVVGCRCG